MSTPNPKISFVIPAYNAESTLEKAVESIFNGNIEEGDEVIIVNDASKDSTQKIIRKLKNKHPLIMHIDNTENKGCPASRNIGIKSSKNILIFNLDSDNVLAPGSIEKLKEYLIEQKADMAAFGEDRYFNKNINKITHKWVYDYPTMTLADFLAGPFNPGPGGNFLYTKGSWEKIGGYWEYGKGLHEAWGFTLKQLAQGAKFVVLPDSFYFHRYGHDSLFITESKKKDESSIMATKMLMNFIDLINIDDLNYIKSEEGSRTWFEKFNKSRPIRLKGNEIGTTGYKVNFKKDGFIDNIKINIPKPIFNLLKKTYNHIKTRYDNN